VLLENMDLAVAPGQDFYRYATGGWQDRTTIPADEASFGVAQELEDLTIEQLTGLLGQLAASDALVVGSDEWKAVRLFEQARDVRTRNAQGIAPVAADLAAIDALDSPEAYFAFLRDAPLTTYVSGLFGIYASPDYADSSVYAAWYGGPDLGLPNRDYYWEDGAEMDGIRAAYREYCADLLQFAGYDADRAADAADRVFAFERRLAEPLLRVEDFNDPANYYHPMPVADLAAANPVFDWTGMLALLGLSDVETVVVSDPAYLDALGGIVDATDLETLKDFLKLQALRTVSDALTEEIAAATFAFYGTTLYGVEEQPPLDEQALDAVNANLGFALGKLYADAYFSPEAKQEVADLVDRLIAATRLRIENLAWMSAPTREQALAKLDTMRVKVGYPDVWQTYEGVQIEESYPASLLSANIAEYRRTLARVGKPVDRDEWFMLPQEVNAYYSATNNEIVFPAAFLQPPFFDPLADPASNYGALGATIGHEITHAFDQSGSQFDANGNYFEWWTDADRARFEALTADVAAQYDAVEALPGVFVDGDLTIGENIADMGGLQIAWDALQAELLASGDPGPIDGLTQGQRFFISYAFSWAEESRDAYVRTLINTDFHAPPQVRGVEPARNMDAFFDAFGIGPDDPEYLPPEDRIVIW
jgi:predicted metalloendopeptidase